MMAKILITEVYGLDYNKTTFSRELGRKWR